VPGIGAPICHALPGSIWRCGGRVGARLEDRDFQSPQGRSSGARRPHRTAAYDRDIDGLHRLAPS